MNSWNPKGTKQEAKQLVEWFEQNARPLPWRASKEPYPIWISEVMLQQTTTSVVKPYFKKFMARFPNIETLAQAPLEEIYTYWAGLGYYSRARCLHKAAREMVKQKSFPEKYGDLLKFPGFGDYTARAVTSQAFEEPVGVVDGNVIRVLCRRFGLPLAHWKHKEKKILQDIADHYVRLERPSQINQAFMELGATLCRVHHPTCLLCPLKKNCVALKEAQIESLPLKKPKRPMEIWQWNVELMEQDGKIGFVLNEYAPFLKKQLILPGQVIRREVAPKSFDFQHSITHHKIYGKITRGKSKLQGMKTSPLTWLSPEQLKEKLPFSLIQKALQGVVN